MIIGLCLHIQQHYVAIFFYVQTRVTSFIMQYYTRQLQNIEHKLFFSPLPSPNPEHLWKFRQIVRVLPWESTEMTQWGEVSRRRILQYVYAPGTKKESQTRGTSASKNAYLAKLPTTKLNHLLYTMCACPPPPPPKRP